MPPPGVQQRDPLGPLAFSLVLHPLIKRIQRDVLGLLFNGWFLDDGTLCSSPEDLLAALNILEEMVDLAGSTSTTPNLSCSSLPTLLAFPALSLRKSPPLLRALSFLGPPLAPSVLLLSGL